MIGLPFLPIVRLLESNVSATSKILTLLPFVGAAGSVIVNHHRWCYRMPAVCCKSRAITADIDISVCTNRQPVSTVVEFKSVDICVKAETTSESDRRQ